MVDNFSDIEEEMNNQVQYNRIVNDAVSYVNSFMEVDSLSNIANHDSNKQLGNFIPRGKDLVLGNLVGEIDKRLYKLYCSILTSLILMQKRYYTDQNGIMRKGVIPSIEAYSSKLQYFMIGTRATGDSRERELHVPQHAMKGWLQKQNKPNPSDIVFGDTKNKTG